jgi:hypothetical protein
MVSRLRNFNLQVFLLGMCCLLASCQDTIPQRSTISPDSGLSKDSQTCPEGQIKQTNADGSFSCVAQPLARPDRAIKFKSDFCGCKDGKAVTFGNCSSYCSSKNTNGAGIFYANFNVTEAISLNSSLVNVKGWCNTPLEDEETNPKCVVKAKDEDNNEITLDVEVSTNSISANIDRLSEDKTYVLTLVETSSGSKSDSIQIIKYSADIPIATLGPLKNAPITQYTCLQRPPIFDEESGDTFFDIAFRVHFYFLPRVPPQPIQAGSSMVCHDYMNPLYGAIDDILFPRLEEIPGIFNLWDNTDPRFYDNNGNGNDDVNDLILQKARYFGANNIPASTKFFVKFSAMTTV